MKAAFDSVNHNLLINKLICEYKLEPWYVKIINEGLNGRVFNIVGVDNKFYDLPCGIPQGSALGPLLFSIFINSINEAITSDFILYADDLVIYTSGNNCPKIIDRLQIEAQNVFKWCQDNNFFN